MVFFKEFLDRLYSELDPTKANVYWQPDGQVTLPPKILDYRGGRMTYLWRPHGNTYQRTDYWDVNLRTTVLGISRVLFEEGRITIDVRHSRT